MIDFIVESENSQDKSNGKVKNNVEKEINDFVQTNGNEFEHKSNGNVDYSNEKGNNYSRKAISRRRHVEHLDYRLTTNKISGNEKKASYLAPNIQVVSSSSNKTDNISLGNLSGKSIKKAEGKGNKSLANTLKKQKKEKGNQQILEKRQIIDRSRVWRKGTCAIVGDSMLNGIDERRISKAHPVKVRFFLGARIMDMYHYLIPILEKEPEHLILHFGTNNAADSSHQQLANDLLALKQFIEEELQNCNVFLSLKRNNQKASAPVNLVNKQLSQLNIDRIENKNMSKKHLGRHRLHLTNHGW